MPDDDAKQSDDKGSASSADTSAAKRSATSRSAEVEAPVERPDLGPRALTATELERLRSRLQKKFH